MKKELRKYGGKALHLLLLQEGGFDIPETYNSEDLDFDKLNNNQVYIVRSSAVLEDSVTQTSAGKYNSLLSVKKEKIREAINEVKSFYEGGSAVIQPDLTEKMEYSGVAYTNLNGNIVISMGKKNKVQSIVNGEQPETEISIQDRNYTLIGSPLNPIIMEKLEKTIINVENYFGRPMDIEFAIIKDNVKLLQARPLPNPTDTALKENEIRKLKHTMIKTKERGLDEIVLGVGNYREILGDDVATPLSVSTFNYIFSGDGNSKLGAMQLGRNELHYDIGYEIHPWVLMLGGKVYYNFIGDALQFRPEGTKLDDLLNVVNKVYLPLVRGDPDLLNYPELQLYIQFPEQAREVGLDPEPYRKIVEQNREAIDSIILPQEAPKKKKSLKYKNLEECFEEIEKTVSDIRTGSAKDYVKAARLAFFALEDLRIDLENLKKNNIDEFNNLVKLYSMEDPIKLRDTIAYDESIGSFEVPEDEDFKYLGSFELTLPRGFPPKRNFKEGKEIPNESIEKRVKNVRKILEYREKVKFFLFRDYEYLSQLYGQFSEISNLKNDIYYLDFLDLPLVIDEPILAHYRIDIEKNIKGKELFGDPIFESDLNQTAVRTYEKKPQLIFGSLPDSFNIQIGKEGYIITAVDQTININPEIKAVFVPDNVRPGSHLFTILSDYSIPVISVPSKELRNLNGKLVDIKKTDNYLMIEELSQ